MSMINNSIFRNDSVGDNFKYFSSAGGKGDGSLLSVGKFAKYADIPRDTLVYYVKKGLIAPAATADNGYKYFRKEQKSAVSFIKKMRSLGIHIDEIKRMNAEMSEREIEEIFDKHRDETLKQLDKMKKSLCFLERLMELMNFADSYESDRPFFRDFAEEFMYQTPVRFCHSLDIASNAELISRFLDFDGDGFPQYLMCCVIPGESLYSEHFCRYMHQNPAEADEHAGEIVRKPAGTYACVVHRGSSGTVRSTVMNLKAYIENAGKEPDGDIYVINSTGYLNLTSRSESKYIVEIKIR